MHVRGALSRIEGRDGTSGHGNVLALAYLGAMVRAWRLKAVAARAHGESSLIV